MSDLITINYALQTCDTASYQDPLRYHGGDRTLLSKKSIKSLFDSIRFCHDTHENTAHCVMIVKDRCTQELTAFIDNIKDYFQSPRLSVEIKDLAPHSGITDSIRFCYEWMRNCSDIVFQVQDDYVFRPAAVENSVGMFLQIQHECHTDAVVQPFNDWYHYGVTYRNQVHNRALFTGHRSYWLQIHDTTCSFLTSVIQFNQHWDLYEKFFELIPQYTERKQQGKSLDGWALESVSLNYMFTRRGVLGIAPINTLTFHVQNGPDPYVDFWHTWNNIDLTLEGGEGVDQQP